MNPSDMVSVIVLSYNAEDFIQECIHSIAMQDYHKVQVILGDDCSEDRTVEKAREILNDSRLDYKICLTKRQSGSFLNLKNAIKYADGQFIAYLEADDYWIDKSKLSKQIKFLESNIEFSGVAGKTIELQNGNQKRNYRNNYDDSFELTDLFGYTKFHSSTFVFRSNVIKYLPNYFSRCNSNDKILFALTAEKGKIGFLQENFSVYRRHNESITKKNSQFKIHIYQIRWLLKINRYFKFRYSTIIYKTLFTVHLKAIAYQWYQRIK